MSEQETNYRGIYKQTWSRVMSVWYTWRVTHPEMELTACVDKLLIYAIDQQKEALAHVDSMQQSGVMQRPTLPSLVEEPETDPREEDGEPARRSAGRPPRRRT